MKEHAPIGRHHIVVKQKVGTNPGALLPVLYLEGSHGYSIMWSLVEYFLAHSSKSDTWMRDATRAVGLFYDYSTATHKSGLSKRAQFSKFLSCLESGTIDTETHQDETGLYWAPTGLDKTKRLRTALVGFIDWFIGAELEMNDKSTFIPPQKKSEGLTLSLLKTARNIIKLTPMSHAKDVVKIAEQLALSKEALGYEFEDDPKNYINAQSENKAFPIELIAPLFQYGFVKNPLANNPFQREDITAKMITLLLLCGGLRKGEPFHLWFNDVIPYSDFQCQAKLYHPRLAKTNLFGEKGKTREEYLKERHMMPRHYKTNTKSLKAGWKKLAVDKSTYHADIFFLHPSAEAMFVTLYQMYLPYRSKLMKTYVKNKGHDHPFLFVSAGVDGRTGESYVGAPYSVQRFTESYDKALKRLEQHLGMRIERGRHSALNPQALRHCYAQLLTDVGVEEKVIQKCMHHRTINAQEAYKGISSQKIQDVLADYTVTNNIQSKLQLTKS